jgi:hypothetical protein
VRQAAMPPAWLKQPGAVSPAHQRASVGDPEGAGRFSPTAALLVDHDAKASLTPRALHSSKIDSVTVCKCGRFRV